MLAERLSRNSASRASDVDSTEQDFSVVNFVRGKFRVRLDSTTLDAIFTLRKAFKCGFHSDHLNKRCDSQVVRLGK